MLIDEFFQSNTVIQNLYDANLERTGGMLPKGWSVSSGRPVDSMSAFHFDIIKKG